MILPILGSGGVSDERQFRRKLVFRDGKFDALPGGGWIDNVKSRNVWSTPLENLEAGLMMGSLTATPRNFATSFIGAANSALTGAGTTLTLQNATQATELVRRIGSTGNLSIVGPPAANGVARQSTLAYSAVNTTTGAVTITAIGANQKERIRFNIASTGGNLQLNVAKTDGTFVTTADIPRNATDATYLASINSALDTATGVVGGVVATAIAATDTDLGFELSYSGTGYAGNAWRRAEVVVYPTSSTAASYEVVTAPVQGAFAAGSLIGDTDGSQVPNTMIPPGYGITVAAAGVTPVSSVEDWAHVPISGILCMTQLAPIVTDLGIQAWIMSKLSSYAGGKYVFTEWYGQSV